MFSGGARSERLASLSFRIAIPSFAVGAACWIAGAVQVAWGIIAVASAVSCGLLVVALWRDRP
jgi:uncharacterized membrane protein YoaK (UPF0700 family)